MQVGKHISLFFHAVSCILFMYAVNVVLLQDAGNDTPVGFLMLVSFYITALYLSYHILVLCFHFFLATSFAGGSVCFRSFHL